MRSSVACFVSPHGFGHAARAAAVLDALHARRPEVHFHLFTTTPGWFFADSLGCPFTLHPEPTDVGLVQTSAVVEDPAATVDRLAGFWPPSPARLGNLARRLEKLNCRLVLADVSPLGLEVARAASLPSVLVENFTWDWVYAAYLAEAPGLAPFIDALAGAFAAAGRRFQTRPACAPHAGAVEVATVSRAFRAGRRVTRERLGVAPGRPLALLTMGGAGWDYSFLDSLAASRDWSFVIPGGAEAVERRGNLVLLPFRSPIFHTDLVAAADVVVGKPGYSTVAEAYRAGSRMILVRRERFPEAPVLTRFARRHLPTAEITADDLASGRWLAELPALLARPRPAAVRENGAKAIAAGLAELLDG